VQKFTEELRIAGRPFAFELCRKHEDFGQLGVDHWWMDTRQLYGQRKGRSHNFDAVTDYFWALCQKYGTASDPEVQESFVLAKILPFARSNAARKIFPDARLVRGASKSRQETIADLNTLLAADAGAISMKGFEEKTQGFLGPPSLASEFEAHYRGFVGEFLGNSRQLVSGKGDQAIAAIVQSWQKIMNSVGRRAGFAEKKQVLDVLSYECRAAFHRCYSAVWVNLLTRLADRYALSTPSATFLGFWHLDHVGKAAQEVPAAFHLFHGHIFALHPASGDLLQTQTGRGLLEAWLNDPSSENAFGRLLNAIYVTLWHYFERYEEQTSQRRKQPEGVGGQELVGLEEDLAELHSGRVNRRSRIGRLR
jgi:hypothetical protein